MLPTTRLIESKLIFVGEISVGKSSLIQYYLSKAFNPKLDSTIGGMYLQKKLTVSTPDSPEPVKIVLNMWDTHGEERFRSLQKIYYRGVSYACICSSFWNFSSNSTSSDSNTIQSNVSHSNTLQSIVNNGQYIGECLSVEKVLESIQYWYTDILKHSHGESDILQRQVQFIVIITKMDLIRKNPNQMKSLDKIKEYTKKIGALYFETSAKEGDGIEELFNEIVQGVISRSLKKNSDEQLLQSSIIQMELQRSQQHQEDLQKRTCCTSTAPETFELR